MERSKPELRNAWTWVPTLYFAEGIPYVIVMYVSGFFYKRMGISNADIAFYTSLIYLPWVIKPLWSPVVDILKTKRFWIVVMQLIVACGLAGLAFSIHLPNYFFITLIFFWLLAFSSATHDIAADGFYMLALNQSEQSFFVGIRSTFYRIAWIIGQGLLIILAGYLEKSSGNIPFAWSLTFGALGILFLLLMSYHKFILPHSKYDSPVTSGSSKKFLAEFAEAFKLFFKKKSIGITIAFLLIYRFGEAQLTKIASLFFLDPKSAGGLALSTSQVGFAYGTIGILALTAGGILGGILVSKHGLKKWIWLMFAAINIPHILYIYLAFAQPSNYFIINLCVAGEQFGYGFGFTAYMLYMISVSEGEFKTAHYAICTGFMALSMMLPGMFSGWLQQMLGYKHFFIWIFITMIPGYFITKYIPIDPEFGKKKAK